MKSLIIAVCAAGVIAVWSEKLPAAELGAAQIAPPTQVNSTN